LVAALGLTAISSLLLSIQFWLQLGGGLFLLWLGSRSLLAKNTRMTTPSPVIKTNYATAFTSTLLLTLANPATVLLFFAVFAGLGIGQSLGGSSTALQLVFGVFLGSSAWWLILCLLAGRLRGHLNDARMRVIHLLTAGSLLLLGLCSLWQAIQAKLL